MLYRGGGSGRNAASLLVQRRTHQLPNGLLPAFRNAQRPRENGKIGKVIRRDNREESTLIPLLSDHDLREYRGLRFLSLFRCQWATCDVGQCHVARLHLSHRSLLHPFLLAHLSALSSAFITPLLVFAPSLPILSCVTGFSNAISPLSRKVPVLELHSSFPFLASSSCRPSHCYSLFPHCLSHRFNFSSLPMVAVISNDNLSSRPS